MSMNFKILKFHLSACISFMELDIVSHEILFTSAKPNIVISLSQSARTYQLHVKINVQMPLVAATGR